MRKSSILILLTAAAFAACQNVKSTLPTTKSDADSSNTASLQVYLRTASKTMTSDSVLLSFTVVNNSDSVQRFVKWETPFEPHIGKYIEVLDTQGEDAQFTGAMARRVMPPPADAYLEVPAHDSLRTEFNLAKNYVLKVGDYNLKYTGGGVSNLPETPLLKITVAAR